MRVELVTPDPTTAGSGNEITARRYSAILRELGHHVTVAHRYDGKSCDLMIALHARKSAESIRRLRELHAALPLIVVLTGTDLYRDISTSAAAKRSLEFATRLVVLQRLGIEQLPAPHRAKTRVIYQSATRLARPVSPPSSYFKVAVIGYLRPEKDPFRTALAARSLPRWSRIRIVQVGRAMTERMQEFASKEGKTNPRYRWVDGLPHWKARRVLAGSHLAALTSRMEGSSNVLCEAIVSSVPVVASAIPGLMGSLGEDYPGYFPVGDTRALAGLLLRAETDEAFYKELKSRCAELAPVLSPTRERDAWQRLVEELT